MKTVIHVTHEAVQKIGGIGAVLQGLIAGRFIVAAEMSWDAVAPNYVLPEMDRALADGRGVAVF